FDGPVAVAAEPELGHENRLVRIAGANLPHEWPERSAILGGAGYISPAELLFVADSLQRSIRRLAANPGPIGDRHPDRTGRVEPVGGCRRLPDVLGLSRARGTAKLVADAPDEDRWVALVGADVGSDERNGAPAPSGLRLVNGLRLVDGYF